MKTDTSKVLIIIVTWNSCQVTAECLDSLRMLAGGGHQVLVIDNASQDDTINVLSDKYPEVILMPNLVNKGFAAACNQGLRYAREHGFGYCFLLNNDTVVDSDVLQAFLSAAGRYPQAGIWGAKIYYYDDPDRIMEATPYWNESIYAFDNLGRDELDDQGRFDREQEIDYANGCALFLRTDVIDSIGFLDERFFIYYEEVDWCFRAKEAGYKVIFVPKAKVWHKVGHSSGGMWSPFAGYFLVRNEFLWAHKRSFIDQRRLFHTKALRFIKGLVAGSYKMNPSVKKRGLVSLAMLAGGLDYLLARFGDCPGYIRSWNRSYMVANKKDKG